MGRGPRAKLCFCGVFRVWTPGGWGPCGLCGDLCGPCPSPRFNDEVKHIKVVEKDSWIHITEAKKFESLLVGDSMAPTGLALGRRGLGFPLQPHSAGPAPAPHGLRPNCSPLSRGTTANSPEGQVG